MTGTALEGLAELARVEAERQGLERQLAVAEEQRAVAEQRHQDAVSRLAAELDDVAKLESMSMTRILAGLRGSRESDLSREQAEAEAARYAATEAENRLSAAERGASDIRVRIHDIGDLEARKAELLAEREQEVLADPTQRVLGAQITALAQRQGALQAEAHELREAAVAAGRAHLALSEAGGLLQSAGDWATYDTFLGGGLMGDMVKYRKLDQAAERIRNADAALVSLAKELADVGIDSVGDIGVTELARTFDVWFDNIFSDWAVRDRIRQALGRVDLLLVGVRHVDEELRRRLDDVTARLSEATVERERLLLG
jgi:hypothetical protein